MNKQRIFEIIEQDENGDRASQQFDTFINIIILLSIILVVLDTYQGFVDRFSLLFIGVNSIISLVFIVEYAFRIWTADLKYPKLSKQKARRAYIVSLYGIVDFLAILPTFLRVLFGINLAVLRVLRLVRILRMKRFKRINDSLMLMGRVFRRKKDELLMVFSLVFVVIFISAILMYYVENPSQPDVFANAGDSIWWAVITLTTVGYGDMYPITAVGRWFGMVIALMGIGVIALPTGILSGGLMDELNDQKKSKKKTCPHCGKELHD